MPLPEAKPTPDKANIYEQFSNIQASDLTRSQLDVIRDPLYLNSQSEDVLRRILLVGQVTDQLSLSGPIPRTATLVQESFTSATPGDTIIFKPGVGEVWQLNSGDILHTGTAGTITFNFSLTDGTNKTFLGSASTTGQEPIGNDLAPDLLNKPIYITSDMYLVADPTSITGTGRVSCFFIRVR